MVDIAGSAILSSSSAPPPLNAQLPAGVNECVRGVPGVSRRVTYGLSGSAQHCSSRLSRWSLVKPTPKSTCARSHTPRWRQCYMCGHGWQRSTSSTARRGGSSAPASGAIRSDSCLSCISASPTRRMCARYMRGCGPRASLRICSC